MSDEYLNHLSSPSSMMSESLTAKLKRNHQKQPSEQNGETQSPASDFLLTLSNGVDLIETKMTRRFSCSDDEIEVSFTISSSRLQNVQKFYNTDCSIICGDLAFDGFTCGFWGYDFINGALALVTLRFFKQKQNN